MGMLIWDRANSLEMTLVKNLNFDFFGAIIRRSPAIADNLKTDPNLYKIVIVPICTFRYANNGGALDINEDLSWADLIICYNHEFVDLDISTVHNAILAQLNNPNYVIITGGHRKDIKLPENKHHADSFHWELSVASSNQFVETNDITSKPWMFDVLFGTNKEDRVKQFYELQKRNLFDCSLVNLTQNPYGPHKDFSTLTYRSPELDTLEDPLILNFLKRGKNAEDLYSGQSLGAAEYCRDAWGYMMQMSCRISWDIYKNCWYTVVSETQPSNYLFLTEKTFKPIFAKRLFVLFSSAGSLKELHRLGYKTFDSIIDESYDDIENTTQRFAKVFDELEKLAKLDPVEVYKQIQPILEHNYNLLVNREEKLLRIKNFIASQLP